MRGSEKLLVKWFRKNPHVLTDGLLRQLLMPASGPTSPVLEALGGPSWLTERERTEKTDGRLSKSCHKCHAREPFVKLSLCAKCKRALYWCVGWARVKLAGGLMTTARENARQRTGSLISTFLL